MPTTGKGGRGRGVESCKASSSLTKEMASREGKEAEEQGDKLGERSSRSFHNFSPIAAP